MSKTGSSPLARGTRRPERAGHRAVRFIPARAGNTLLAARGRAPAAVHPRSRGEHPVARRMVSTPSGSSPLARGTQPRRRRLGRRERFIPARAGNTTSSPCRAPRAPVHPRSRGEHPSANSAVCSKTGSSPLARGTPGAGVPAPGAARFIPARAGNTWWAWGRARSPSVHPRSRGEHPLDLAPTDVARGSSPLARGTRPSPLGRPAAMRFIPARAGNTAGACPSSSRRSVHPRSRGEHAIGPEIHAAQAGSSPLARGTRLHRLAPGEPGRFIPARAGNTSGRTRGASSASVHPRSRGEH